MLQQRHIDFYEVLGGSNIDSAEPSKRRLIYLVDPKDILVKQDLQS